MKIERDNPYFSMVSHQWGEALKNSLAALPKFSLE
jgi:predicted proteasome-type protease